MTPCSPPSGCAAGPTRTCCCGCFASRGLGAGSSSAATADPDPVPSFAAGTARRTAVRFIDRRPRRTRPHLRRHPRGARPAGGRHRPGTPLGDRVTMTPGTYRAWRSARPPATPGSPSRSTPVRCARPRAGRAQRRRRGQRRRRDAADGVNAAKLIDGTEGTNWASVDAAVRGKGVTVDLAGTRAEVVTRVQVSAALRPQSAADADPAARTATRRCGRSACWPATRPAAPTARGPASYTPVFTSPADAFPADPAPPAVIDLRCAASTSPPIRATHVRFEVLACQCTGGPAVPGRAGRRPAPSTDCTCLHRRRRRARRRAAGLRPLAGPSAAPVPLAGTGAAARLRSGSEQGRRQAPQALVERRPAGT